PPILPPNAVRGLDFPPRVGAPSVMAGGRPGETPNVPPLPPVGGRPGQAAPGTSSASPIPASRSPSAALSTVAGRVWPFFLTAVASAGVALATDRTGMKPPRSARKKPCATPALTPSRTSRPPPRSPHPLVTLDPPLPDRPL